MKRKNSLRYLLAGLALVLGLFAPGILARAAGTQNVTNLVIFVKYADDGRDIFNAVYSQNGATRRNWDVIKGMYEEDGDSFQRYISTVTEGKVAVKNLFPQERTVTSEAEPYRAVETYTLANGEAYYTEDVLLLREVLTAINAGTISLDGLSDKLDNLYAGDLDNLTVVVQGGVLPGNSDSPHKSQFEGAEVINLQGTEIRVRDYNMLMSSVLVEDDASVGVRQAQGVIAHEFLHTLGLMDLYRSGGSGKPVGLWDVMASNSCFLQYPLSYVRAQKGWVNQEEITTDGTYTLTAVSEPGEDNKLYVLRTPVSDSELIVLEFRRKSELVSEDFERKIPSTGLLMYRVDTKVTDKTNFKGQNYIYVYRPGVTAPEAAADMVPGTTLNLVDMAGCAALGECGAYGTTDLDADFRQDTLYYSDGRNSGIRISDVKISDDQKKITFRVEFADYDNSDVWAQVGEPLSSNVPVNSPCLYTNPENGDLYGAYVTEGKVIVKRWNGTAWEQTGNAIENVGMVFTPRLAVCAGDLYLAYQGAAGQQVVCAKLNNGIWEAVSQLSANNPLDIQLIADGANLYVAYQETIADRKNRLVIADVKKNAVIVQDKTAGYFSSPSVTKTGSSFYVLYADLFSPGAARVEIYDTSKKAWSPVREFDISVSTRHIIQENNGKIYALVGASQENPVLSVYDGAQWSDTVITQIRGYSYAFMEIIQDEVYLTFSGIDGGKTVLLRKNGDSFEVCYDNIGTGIIDLSFTSRGSTMYAATRAENSDVLLVKEKELSLPQYELSLTAPDGYTDSQVYIDGVPYAAELSGNRCRLMLPHSNGRTAVMYCYNAGGVPVGMYVWKLEFQNGAYTAVALPGLQDLLSYHGFSIRVTSPAGIRFKSGVDSGLRDRLLAEGVDGYRLSEYGTLFMTNANRSLYPFRKLGRKTGGGRSYWTEDGVVNDKVFETIAGRKRFASVLINLPKEQYATDFAFRGYMILENGEERILLYGAPVYRSIYTVAQQVQAKGEFAVGSKGYKYVQGIIDSVEGR